MLNIYMAGLIYLNGCDQEVKRAYAPDGTGDDPPHHASLWITAADLDQENWWSGQKISHPVNGDTVFEFRIPEPSTLWFPDDGNAADCYDLDEGLPKLKKKKQDGTEEDFDVDPANAETIAEVTIRGGEIRPRRFKDITVVQWTITAPPTRQITAVIDETGEPRTITVKNPAEVIFANIHDAGAPNPGDHVDVFRKLNSVEAGAVLVSTKARGSVGHLDASIVALNFIRPMAKGEGDTPGCCCPGSVRCF
jgi:hypothetical protein